MPKRSPIPLKNEDNFPLPEKRGRGRPPGPAATTLAVREAIKLCATRMGGANALYEWAISEPYRTDIFWKDIYMKLLPIEVTSHLTITHEEALDELERRFPRFVDGKPVKYLERLKAPHVEAD
jgi:hypothetical protein